MILQQIIDQKKKEIKELSLNDLEKALGQLPKEEGKSFANNLRKNGEVALIAEIKKASPSKGILRQDFDVETIIQIYSGAGASAISVLTDRNFFKGSTQYLIKTRRLSDLPLLRKDFIIHPCQIYESKLLGADAVLLIMAVLTDNEAHQLYKLTYDLGMECLVEVHTEQELSRALALGAEVIGINNRDLYTFETRLETTFKLREMITDPNVTIVSESGINTRNDVKSLKDNGIHAMLVGEALMREQNISCKIQELLGYYPQEKHTAGETRLC